MKLTTINTSLLKYLILSIAILFANSIRAQVNILGGVDSVVISHNPYPNLKSAIDTLNAHPNFTDSVFVNVNASFVDTLTEAIVLTATGTNSTPLFIQKIGTGSNPKLISYQGSHSSSIADSLFDAMFILKGTDYLTIDGIDLEENQNNMIQPTVQKMEYGFLFTKLSNDGCQYNTIKNCNIKFINYYFYGGKSTSIAFENFSVNRFIPAITLNSIGTNSYNHVYNNYIDNSTIGITLNSFVADSANINLFDAYNIVGDSIPSLGNKITNYGAWSTYIDALGTGIQLKNQNSLICSNNAITNDTISSFGPGTAFNAITITCDVIALSATCHKNKIGFNTHSLLQYSETGINLDYGDGISESNLNASVSLIGNTFNSESNNNNYNKGFTAITSRVRSDNDPFQCILGELNITDNKIENIKQIGGSNYGLINCNMINGVKDINIERNTIKNLEFNSIGTNLISISNNGWGPIFNVNTKSIIRNNLIDSIFFNNNYLSQTFTAINTTSYKCEVNGNSIKNLFFKGTNGTITLLTTYYQTGGQAIIKNNLITNIIDSSNGLNLNIISTSNNGSNSEISNNIISNLKLNSFDDIYLVSAPLNLITNNQIYNIENRGVGGIIGIHCGNVYPIYISNNIIANFKRSNNANATITGILLGGQNKNYLTNNTILIKDYTNNNIKGISLNNGKNVLINNLINIGSANNKATCLYGYGLNYYDSLSGNNLFYSGTPDTNHIILEDAGVSFQTLADFKNYLSPINAEQNSQTENVTFMDTIGSTPFFLKPDTTIPTLAESNGQVISNLYTDIANNIRYGNDGYTGSGYGYDIGAWEFEGKAINFCNGAPNSGVANVYHIPCTNKISMSLDSNSQNGNIKYQWQRSPDSINLWVNLNNNNLDSFIYNAPFGSNAYYRCVTTCVLSGLSDTSTVSNKIYVEQFNPQGTCYCPSTFTSTTGADIGQVKFGALQNPIQNIAIQTNDTSANKKYSNFTNLTAKRFNQGQYYPITIKQITSSATLQSAYVKVFIDYNHNNSFTDSSEQVIARASNSGNSFTVLDSILIPLSATIGKTRMRVILQQGGNNAMTSCQNATTGETEDYVIEILPPCNNTYIDLISPNEGGNIGDVTVNLYGGCFESVDSIIFTNGATSTTLLNSSFRFFTSNYISLTIDTRGIDTGSYYFILFKGNTLYNTQDSFYVHGGQNQIPKVFFVGPNNIRLGTKEKFYVIVQNESNVNLTGQVVWVAIPTNCSFELKNQILKTLSPGDTLDNIDIFALTDTLNGVPANYNLIPLIIPFIESNSTFTLEFEIKALSTQSTQLHVWTTKSLYQSPLDSNQVNCILDILAISFANANVPVYGCLYTFVDAFTRPIINCEYFNDCSLAYSLATGMGNDGVISMLRTMVGMADGCPDGGISNTLSVDKAKKIVKRLSDLSDYYDILSDCVLPFVQKSYNSNKTVTIVNSVDPNDKYGPTVYENSAFVSSSTEMYYSINYENDSSATAPAQVVIILDTLDTNVFDLSSFQLGNYTIGDSSFSIPNGLKTYHTQIDLSAKGIFYAVDVNAQLNNTTGVVSWIFTTLDLNTLLPATGVFDGFLPPNIISPQGQGSVSFSIKVKDSIANNTAINNSAAIYFDNNAPIITPTWLNTIDDEKPISNVLALSDGCDSIFTVSWSGTDSQAGIAGYDVYFSVNGNSAKPLISNTSLTNFTFTGNYDSTYSFYSIAKDKAGNIEDAPITFDATTTIKKAKCNLVVDSFATCNIYINSSLYDTIGNVGFQWYRDSVLLPNTTPNIILPLGADTSKVYCKISFCNFGVSYSDTLTIPKMQTYYDSSSAQICLGQSYSFYGNTYTSGGTYSEAFNTIYGCDSIKTVTLTVNPTSHDTINANICNGQTYSYNGNSYSTNGFYPNTFSNVFGCDSFKTIHLIVNPTSNDTINTSICFGQTYTYNGNNYTASGYYLNTFTNVLGCDSLKTINLTVNPTSHDTLNASICNGQTYSYNGNSYSSSGYYPNTFTNLFGCDSIKTIHITVNPTSTDTLNASICDGQTYTFNGNNYNSTGYYPNVFTNTFGCDSIKTINLTVNPTTLDTLNVSICNGQTYTYNGNSYNSDGFYLNTFQNIYGCDSNKTIHLTVNPISSDTLNAAICNGATYTFNSNSYTTQGYYPNNFSNIFGCDSVVTVNLTVHPNPVPQLVFDGTSLVSNGGYQSYSWYQNGSLMITNTDSSYIVPSNGTYKVEVIDSNGCVGLSDSVVVIGLYVSDISNSKFDISVYPNPASSYLNIKVKNKLTCNATFILYDLMGNKIISKNLDKKQIVTIPTNQVLTGEYNYVFICDGQRIEKGKLIFR